ncbi:MAG: immunoglobulin domain-containing protein, partial [Chitinispirillia bacterium]
PEYKFEVEEDDGGIYYCRIKNKNHSIKSKSVELKIAIPVIIKSHPENTEGWTGKSATFTVTVTGTPPINYQWQMKEDGKWENVSGSFQNRTLTISELENEDAGEYRCIASDNEGNQKISRSAELTVLESIKITNQLQNQEKWIGEKVTFKIETRGNKKGIRYSWKHDNLVVKDSDKDEFTFKISGMGQQGEYSCEVKDGGGSVNHSNEAFLLINETASISKNPKNRQINLGEDATFNVKAKGKEPITFQWFHDDSEMDGENSSTLKIQNARPDDAGKYRCRVENRGGSDLSSYATLAVSGKLNILEQPKDVVSFSGPDHTAEFSILVIGSEPIEYQWQYNGEDIEGEDFKELEIEYVTSYHAGTYRCVIKNEFGETISNEGKLVVRRTVEITKQPQKKTSRSVGETARFSISASGYGNIEYQWQKIARDYEWLDLKGENKATLEINMLTRDHSGQYRCMVKNGGGEVASDFADLIIEGPITILDPLKDEHIGWTGNEITFSIGISGSDPIIMQWYKTGMKYPIHIVRNHSSPRVELTLTNLIESDKGEYYCIIDNSFNNPRTSKTTKLIVKKSVCITEHPENKKAKQGEKIRMSIKAEGDGNITYQWLKDGIEQPEYISKTLIFENVSSSQSGLYQCIATNEGGSDTSESAYLNVEGTITITQPSTGDQWKINTIKKIKWICEDDNVKLVNIWFSKDGGKKYEIIGENVDVKDGEHPWLVKNITSSQCKIKISSSDDFKIDDETDGFFKISTFDIPIRNFRNKSRLFSRDQFKIFPNPVRGNIDHSVSFALDSPVKIVTREISIYDALGNRIAFMPSTQLLQENNRCNLGTWNLSSRSGEKITNGAYLAVLTITDTNGNRHILTKLLGIHDQP